jgi:carbonic anhydrase
MKLFCRTPVEHVSAPARLSLATTAAKDRRVVPFAASSWANQKPTALLLRSLLLLAVALLLHPTKTEAVETTLRSRLQRALFRRSGSSRRNEPLEWAEHGADWDGGNCANRDLGSPINFDDFETPLMLQRQFAFNYVPLEVDVELKNDGVTIGLDLSHLSEEEVGGIRFDNGFHKLERVDFHARSEHTFKGRHLPLEVQLTHKMPQGKSKIIVSVLVDADIPEEEAGGAGAAALLLQERERRR